MEESKSQVEHTWQCDCTSTEHRGSEWSVRSTGSANQSFYSQTALFVPFFSPKYGQISDHLLFFSNKTLV